MRKSKAETAETHQRIIERASVLLRERGIDGIGLSDLMQEAGLTHGGFYRHFASKSDLVAKACGWALAENAQKLWRRIDKDRETGLEALVTGYLTERHCADRGHGCTVAALAADAARHDSELRGVFTAGVGGMIDSIAPLMRGPTPDERRSQAAAVAATMIGALTIARATSDPGLARTVLDAARRAILADTGPDHAAASKPAASNES
jgi:TetR/AcrR family transcriptional repressor of nem operon